MKMLNELLLNPLLYKKYYSAFPYSNIIRNGGAKDCRKVRTNQSLSHKLFSI